MFKKISILALLLVGATGAYALVANLFPETVEFPRIPMQAGTIGEMLGKLLGTTDIEGSDGTVGNTMTLSGESARNYLQNTTCTNLGEVWIGIDADGKAICGPQGGMPLAFGYIQDFSGTVTIVHADNSTTVVAWIHQALVVGDIVETSMGAAATIAFDFDNSILRLDEGTLVELQQSSLGGNTVAEAILQDGSLWGRILTSTGINFSADGYIAGVRGTSIAMTKNGSDVTIAIPHSRNSAPGSAGILTCPQSSTALSVGSSFTLTGELSCPHIISTDTLANLYTDTWIRENTKKDILTMNVDTYKTVFGMMKVATLSELEVTMPSDIVTCQKLISGDILTLSGSSFTETNLTALGYSPPAITPSTDQLTNVSCGDILNPDNRDISPKITRCAIEGKTYWSVLDVLPLSQCQDNTTLMAANLTDMSLSGKLYTKGGSGIEMDGGLIIGQGVGVTISSVGDYISYSTGLLNTYLLPYGGFAGKTVTLRVDVADIKRTGGPYFLVSYSGAVVQGAWLLSSTLNYGKNPSPMISQSISTCLPGLPSYGPVDISLSATNIQILRTDGTLICSTSGTASISNPSQFFIGAKNSSSGQWGGNISQIIIK